MLHWERIIARDLYVCVRTYTLATATATAIATTAAAAAAARSAIIYCYP